ncbi:Ureidoglycolate hydrolase [Aminobacter sp. DSM 101952]|uniref:ureidoglycolate lyase n=1 Tax=Aminobacter sp. DSM 101952 TaxID=2735891 RepID=UPI0006FC76A2|nr:ureidoglycolate lyase [Aminobacter sp. DSM 101952]KQU71592.1 Ureidoglycolate hydrolase [Aminobacter sp. DSM 101952]
MPQIVDVEPLTRDRFREFGDVIEIDGDASYPINGGMADRFHDMAKVEASGPEGRVLISMVRSRHCELPLVVSAVERHPYGSQAFIPTKLGSFLVVVCLDRQGVPQAPRAFIAQPGQGVNYHSNVWHGVLSPLVNEQDFLVVDRGGLGSNLEEYNFAEPYVIEGNVRC